MTHDRPALEQPPARAVRLKTRVGELALTGGAPLFREAMHVGRPNIPDRRRLWPRLNDLLDRRWLTNNGRYVQEFEHQVAGQLGVRHCVAVSSGTMALDLAARALDLAGEVIVPSFTSPATVHALQWQGISPVFCDVTPDTHSLDHRRVEELISPRTTGILAVHLWGEACAIDELTEIAERHHLSLLFDAAHAFGCSYKGTMIGHHGRAEAFSFHATKFVNSVEGGAVATNDDRVAARVRLIRNLGFRGLDDVAGVGINGRMNEISAAMGLTALESLEDILAINRRNYLHYHQALASVPGVTMLTLDVNERRNHQYIVLEIDEEAAGLSRDDLVRILHAENVRAKRYFFPGCHRMPPYRDLYPDAAARLPVTEKLTGTVLCLPTGAATQPDDIDGICGIVRLCVRHAGELRPLVTDDIGSLT